MTSKIILAIILILIALCAVSLARSKYALTSSEFEISSSKVAAATDAASAVAATTAAPAAGETQEPLRIVELADLHNAVFGEDNSRLTELVRAQDPDLILMAGDMVQEDDA
ncbi:MAG: hypothetical protein IJV59_05615, partial [Eubacterium sp.]|nr:hypothetical protein [Eubacterium sp.]